MVVNAFRQSCTFLISEPFSTENFKMRLKIDGHSSETVTRLFTHIVEFDVSF